MMPDRIRVTILEPGDSEALLAMVGRCSAMTLYRRFHGVLVGGGWQRRGVGTALVVALVRRARERRSAFLRADLLADNHFALQALASVGPMSISLARGSYTVLIDLGLGTALVQIPSLTTTPNEILPVQAVYEAVGPATTPSGRDGLRSTISV
jgi:GNAT superfamily N-acetyltransferase